MSRDAHALGALELVLLAYETEARADRFEAAGLTWRQRLLLNLTDCGAGPALVAEVLGCQPASLEREVKRLRHRVLESPGVQSGQPPS